MIFVPLVITTFLFFLLGDSDVHLSLATNSQNPSVIKLLKKDADVTVVDDLKGIDENLKSGKYDAYIKYTDQEQSFISLKKIRFMSIKYMTFEKLRKIITAIRGDYHIFMEIS